MWLRKAIRREPGAGWSEGDLKTHQQRRIALDVETVAVLREHIERCRQRAAALGTSCLAGERIRRLDADNVRLRQSLAEALGERRVAGSRRPPPADGGRSRC